MYDGYGSKYDFWINVTDSSIHKKGAMTYKTVNTRLTAEGKDQPKIYDYNDLNFNFVQGDKFVIRRVRLMKGRLANGTRSSFFLKNLNNFGRLGGFDLIL